MRLDITVVDLNGAVTAACADYGFRTVEGDILNVPGILVSPANSFGWMDGGIDLVYANKYPHLQDAVRDEILRKWRGELPVGHALAVRNPDAGIHPWLIVTPTMRTPATDARGTLNAYLAMRAAVAEYLRLAFEWMPFDKPSLQMVTPGLCTASGRMEPYVAARQMLEGAMAASDGPKLFDSWVEQKQHENNMRGISERAFW